jgi:hypothetical protein
MVRYVFQIKKRPRGDCHLPRPGPRREPLSNTSLAQPTRTVRVDQELLEEISELTSIEYRALCRAFVSEEKNLVLDIVKSALAENLDKTPGRRTLTFGPRR